MARGPNKPVKVTVKRTPSKGSPSSGSPSSGSPSKGSPSSGINRRSNRGRNQVERYTYTHEPKAKTKKAKSTVVLTRDGKTGKTGKTSKSKTSTRVLRNLRKKIKMSGEIFDLSIPSYNSKFGKEHIKHTITNGINFKIEKFIHELEMIVEGTSDDKTEKRRKRLIFLEKCSENKYIKELFEYFITYLNGGDLESRDFKDSFIIITVTGGNVFTLFAQLIKNIIDHKKKPDKIQLTPTNQLLIGKLQQKYDRTVDVIDEIYQYSITFNEMISDITSNPYSDFDFKASPNKSPTPSEVIKELKRQVNFLEYEAGFLLFRIKSNLKRTLLQSEILKSDNKDFKSSCNDDIKQLYTQIVQQKHYDTYGCLKKQIEKDKIDCCKYIKYLLDEKKNIEENTIINVKTIKKLFQQGKFIKHGLSNVALLSPQLNEIEALIQYIHSISIYLNEYLLMRTKNGDFGTYQDLCNMFVSLNSFSENGLFFGNLGLSVLNFYLQYPSFFIEEIINNIIENVKLKYKRTEVTKEVSDLQSLHTLFQNALSEQYGQQIKQHIRRVPGLRLTMNCIKQEQDDILDLPLDELMTGLKI
jgi:hypothetical protein